MPEGKRCFRVQPIINAQTHETVALELLSAERLPLGDEKRMLLGDIAAIHHAAQLAKETGLRIHANVEYASLILGLDRIVKEIGAGTVIELTERHEPLSTRRDAVAILRRFEQEVRRKGARIAMDDVTVQDIEIDLIHVLRPEIIKVDNRDAMHGIKTVVPRGTIIIAERIEHAAEAELARRMGAHELQGFWCDRIAE